VSGNAVFFGIVFYLVSGREPTRSYGKLTSHGCRGGSGFDFGVMGIHRPHALGSYALEALRDRLDGGTTDRLLGRSPVPVVTVRT